MESILKQGDSYELIKQLPDNSVDLVCIDPPYLYDFTAGGGGCYGDRPYYQQIKEKAEHLKNGFDFSIFDEFERVCKVFNAYIFCSVDLLEALIVHFNTGDRKGKYNTDILMAHKNNPIQTCHNHYIPDTEYIYYVRKAGATLWGTSATKKKYMFYNLPNELKKEFDHPTIKPVEVIKTLITNSTQEGGVVLDCFAGTGTTGVACIETDRKYILFEYFEDYMEFIKVRLERAEAEHNSKKNIKSLLEF